jgi:hypothetical protein
MEELVFYQMTPFYHASLISKSQNLYGIDNKTKIFKFSVR